MVKFRYVVVLALALAGTALGTAGPAAAQEGVQYLGPHRDWHAFEYLENRNKVCYVAAKPSRSEPANVRHGDVFLLIAHRPAENSRNVVSLTVGYNYGPGSEAEVTIGGKTFPLFTENNTAWSRDAASDEALVAAMKAGSSMTVKAVSARGTSTTYTISLAGVTAALNAIDSACGS